MSVIVKMEMPKHCGECNLYVNGWCYGIAPDSKEEKEWHSSHKERPPLCPILCELPEKHGRLVDARVAYDKIAEQETSYYMDMDGVDMGLDETPTIVPAEGIET